VTTNRELLERRRRVSPAWLAAYYQDPIALARGEGRYVWDVEGQRYLDFFGGIVTTIAGHGVPEIVAAIGEQAGRIIHTSTLYLSEPAVELAELIASLSGIPDARVFLTTSGTEATEAALLLATAYRRSNQVLAMRNGYHGRSFAAVAVTGHRSWSPTGFTGLNVHYVLGSYPLRSPFRGLDDQAYIDACVQDLRQVIDTTTAGDVACLIAEPIQGVGGFTHGPDGLLGAMEEVLDERGILLVVDEVQTGWGRTGEHFWGYQAHGVTPDLMTFAKGVGNGMSLAGVVARAEVMDCLGASSISTFGGDPVSAAAGLATLHYLLDHDLQGNALRMGERLAAGLEAAVAGVEWVAEVRGKGLLRGVETVQPGGLEPAPGLAAQVLEGCKQRGLLVGKGGLYGNVLRISPPLTVTAEEVDIAVGVITEVVAAVDAEQPAGSQ
jgi:4-aminobutyrate aminotransferase